MGEKGCLLTKVKLAVEEMNGVKRHLALLMAHAGLLPKLRDSRSFLLRTA